MTIELRPSSSNRWMKCSGSIYYDLNRENTSGPAAERGTYIHDIAGNMLLGKDIDVDVDDEALSIASQYFDYVRTLHEEMFEPVVYVEERMELDEYTGGTPDCVLVERSGDVVHIVDLKTGRGQVSAEENSQLMLYLVMIINALDINVNTCRMVLHIVQPTVESNSWTVNADYYRAFVLDYLQARERIVNEKAEYSPSPDVCRWCLGAAECSARREDIVKDFVDHSDPLMTIKTLDLNPGQLAQVLDRAQEVAHWVKSVEELALKKAVDGAEIPGYRLGTSKTIRQWEDEEQAKNVLINEVGSDAQLFNVKIISPAQAEKLVGKDVVKDLAFSPEGKPKLFKQ